MDLDREQQQLLATWRALALERMPYMASVLFSVRVVDSPGCGTFAVDKSWRMYVDFKSVAEWGAEGCAQVLLHECGHLLLGHADRAESVGVQDQDRLRWNVAADMEWNDDLVKAGCDFVRETGQLPETHGLAPNDIAEHYYKRLSNPESPAGGCGSGSGGNREKCELPEGVGPTAPSAVDQQLARIAAASAAKGRGDLSGRMSEWIESILAPPQVPWQRTLSAAVKRGVAERSGMVDSSILRRNRHKPYFDIGESRVLNPGWYTPSPRLVVVRDTSGSMSSKDLEAVCSEIDGIARQIGIRGDDLLVLDVDAAVQASRGYQGRSSIAMAKGRGGTNMGVGIEAVARSRPKPSCVVVITDGDTPWPTEKPTVPVVICIVGQSHMPTPAWAPVVRVQV